MGKLWLQPGQARLRGLGGVRLSHLTDETTSPVRQRKSIETEALDLDVEVTL